MSVRTFSQTVIPGQPFVTRGGTALLIRAAENPIDIALLLHGQSVGALTGVEAGLSLADLPEFDSLSITSATQQVVTVDVGTGKIGAPSAGQVQAVKVQASTLGASAIVDVGVAAVEVFVASASTKMIVFRNTGATTIYLGGPDVSANSPISLASGATWVEDAAAAATWYAISSAAGGTLAVMGAS